MAFEQRLDAAGANRLEEVQPVFDRQETPAVADIENLERVFVANDIQLPPPVRATNPVASDLMVILIKSALRGLEKQTTLVSVEKTYFQD